MALVKGMEMRKMRKSREIAMATIEVASEKENNGVKCLSEKCRGLYRKEEVRHMWILCVVMFRLSCVLLFRRPWSQGLVLWVTHKYLQ